MGNFKMKGSTFYGKKISYGSENIASPLKAKKDSMEEYARSKKDRKDMKSVEDARAKAKDMDAKGRMEPIGGGVKPPKRVEDRAKQEAKRKKARIEGPVSNPDRPHKETGTKDQSAKRGKMQPIPEDSPLDKRDVEVWSLPDENVQNVSKSDDLSEFKKEKNLGTRDPKAKNYNPDLKKNIALEKAKKSVAAKEGGPSSLGRTKGKEREKIQKENRDRYKRQSKQIRYTKKDAQARINKMKPGSEGRRTAEKNLKEKGYVL